MVPKHTFQRFCGIGLLALPLLLAACNSHHLDVAPPLAAEPNSPVSDAPIPAGYKIMDAKSTSRLDPVARERFVDHSYSGGSSILQVARFYRDTMPAKGWTFVSQDEGRHDFTLNFTKNNETAVVTIWHGDFATHIRIKIDPTAQPVQPAK